MLTTSVKEKNKEKLFKRQVSLSNKINNLGFSIVTCGNCSAVNIQEHTDHDEQYHLKCFKCSYVSEQCDFPDLFN